MMDLKVFNSAIEQLEDERGIAKEKIIEAVETALAAAYKKDYGKRRQIIRGHFDINTGNVDFEQIKIVVDDSTVRIPDLDEEGNILPPTDPEDDRVLFDPEKHILLEDAKKIKKDAEIEDEITFPLETRDDYGRIAAQTAKQVIIQKIREAEKSSVLDEYSDKKGEVVSGTVQRIERGNVFVDLGRTVGFLPSEEQIPNEHYRQGGRVKAYVVDVSEGPRGINIRLSRTHPEFLKELFAIEAPEVANDVVEIKGVSREPGSRSKIAVMSHDEKVDPIGACVGQRGIRVSTITNELAGEKIDVIPWSDEPAQFISDTLAPARVSDVEIEEAEHRARVIVAPDQFSLAIGKGGQNVRLAARLAGWRIDIESTEGDIVDSEKAEEGVAEEPASGAQEIDTSAETPEVAPKETQTDTQEQDADSKDSNTTESTPDKSPQKDDMPDEKEK